MKYLQVLVRKIFQIRIDTTLFLMVPLFGTVFTSWENRKERNLSSFYSPYPIFSHLHTFAPGFVSFAGRPCAPSVNLVLSLRIQATTVSCLHLLNLEAISIAAVLVHSYFIS